MIILEPIVILKTYEPQKAIKLLCLTIWSISESFSLMTINGFVQGI